ncbi:hypothetical protein HN011_002451 [Eciton burchellii]|nr:hypothetical protein HN011_002451 [Eciton burchellii]
MDQSSLQISTFVTRSVPSVLQLATYEANAGTLVAKQSLPMLLTMYTLSCEATISLMSEITCTRLATLIIDARAHVKQNAAEKLALILRDRDMRWFRVNISAISPISPGGFWLLKPK